MAFKTKKKSVSGFLRFWCAKLNSMWVIIDFGDRYIQLKDNKTVDSGSLKGDGVREKHQPS